MRTLLALAVALLVVAALGGCGGSSKKSASAASTAGTSAIGDAATASSAPSGAIATAPPNTETLSTLPPATGLGSRRASCVASPPQINAGNINTFRSVTLCLLNAERSARGLGSLRSNANLQKAAQGFAAAMVRQKFFDHVSPSGSTFDQRIRQTGYLSSAHSFAIGENLGYGSGTTAPPEKVVDLWMHSPPHRANILNGKFKEIGIGIVIGEPLASSSSDPALTYTTEFGARG